MNNSFVMTDDSTFEMAIEAIDKGGIGFLAVIEESGSLVGILTDGDVRRAFLKKNYKLASIINKKPEVMNHLSSRQEIILKLKSLHRRHMPLVDADGKFKRVFSLDEVDFYSRDNVVVIMAGGLGSRLGELTKEIPKPMLNVGSRPMLQHLVELFREQGFSRFIFCVNYKKEVIKEFFQDGSRFDVQVTYVEENQKLGTAGALSLIENKFEAPFIVINADILTNVNFPDLIEYHEKSAGVATMCVRAHEVQIPYGVVNSDENSKLVTIEEKPVVSFNVNAGIYVLDPIAVDYIPNNKYFDMPTLFDTLSGNDLSSCVYHIRDYWLDIGRREDLQRANNDLSIKSS